MPPSLRGATLASTLPCAPPAQLREPTLDTREAGDAAPWRRATASHLFTQVQSQLPERHGGELFRPGGFARRADRVPIPLALAPLPPAATARLTDPAGAGGIARPGVAGEAGGAACGDLVRVELAVEEGRVAAAGYRVSGCPAATAAASALREAVEGASLEHAMSLAPADLDAMLGGMGPAHRHGCELAVEALAAALESWCSARLGDAGPEAREDRVAVAMSGGVDSAVAALLLHRAGLDVIGVTMRLWHDPASAPAARSCCAPETVRLARASAHAIGIPHVSLDVAERFRRVVVEGFVAGYANGRTPNPCVTCNGEARFAILADAARLLGARAMASGHYARVDRSGPYAVLARAGDGAKDQSYMLARLPQDVLERLRLPLGERTKDEVRAIAREAALPAADAVESQEVCFVGDGGYARFLEGTGGLASRPGPVLDESGRVVGEHGGHWRFTVGQRRGLGGGPGPARYVTRIDAGRNAVVVGPAEALAVGTLLVEDAVVHTPIGDGPLEVRVRYRGHASAGVARPDGPGRVRVDLLEPARAVAPGQTAVLYRDDVLVAVGTIAGSRGASEAEEA